MIASSHVWATTSPSNVARSECVQRRRRMTTSAPDESDNRRTITGPCPVATCLIGSVARRVEHLAVFTALLTGVLIEFVGFGHWVGERCGRGKMRREECVYLVSS